MEKKRDLILSVSFNGPSLNSLIEFKKNNPGYRIGLVLRTRDKLPKNPEMLSNVDVILRIDFSSEKSIIKAIAPIRSEVAIITCRRDPRIVDMAKIIAFFPDVAAPSSESLTWSSNKILMRQRFKDFSPEISPKFMIVTDSNKNTIEEIIEKVGFPLIIKPASAAQSLLVSINYHEEELTKNLRSSHRKIKSMYNKRKQKAAPEFIVEQYIEGQMYSVDAFVEDTCKIHFCPFVHIKTGREIGFDDFFGYRQITPTLLNDTSVADAQAVCKKAVDALSLRSTSVHIELFRTEDGWKVIEVNPRLGGFRSDMYRMSYGINLDDNDIYVRSDKSKVKISTKIKGYTAALKIFGKKEGKITSIKGVKKIQELESFHSIVINKKVGDRNLFSKNGGYSVMNITLFNKERSQLLADIRRLESATSIEVK